MASASNSKTIYSSGSTQPWTLTTAFNETGTSNTNNTSTITVTATIGATGTKFSTNKNNSLKIYWYDNNENTAGILVAERIIQSTDYNVTYTATDSITVKHKTDGTLSGYALTTWAKASGAGNYVPSSNNVQTSNTNLTTIPRVSTLNSVTISISNDGSTVTAKPNFTRYSNTFHDTLVLFNGNQQITATNVENGVAKSISPSALYNIFGTATEISLSCYLMTYQQDSATPLGVSNTIAATATLPSYSLTQSMVITDNVTTYNTYKNNANDLIANLSQPNLVFSATSSTGSTYGRPITHTINNEASTSPKTINNYTGGNFTLVSTDGRKTATVTTSNTVIPYQRPTISCKLERTSSTSDTASVTITGKYYDGNGLKTSALLTRSIVLNYTETGGTQQTITSFTTTSSTSNHIVSFTATTTLTGLDYKKSIDYNATITDLINVSNTVTGNIPQGLPVWNAYKDLSNNQYFNVNGAILRNGINIVESGSNINGSYVKYADGTMICYKTITDTIDIDASTMGGAFYYGAVHLGNTPQAFTSRPTIIVSPQTQTGTQYFLSGSVGADYGTNTSFGQVTLLRPAVRTGVAYILDVMAIGKWV